MADADETLAVTIDDIRAAAAIVEGHVVRTPTLRAPALSALTGADVFVKYENMQATGAFKERGAIVRLEALSPQERERGVIAMSAGNHAQAVAFHAKRLGIPATIVMPLLTPMVKVLNTKAHGARVILHGETLSEAQTKCAELAQAEALTLVHPYDDPRIIAGQGTIALEMLADAPDLDMLVVPVGGGGLIGGIAVAAHAIRPDIEIVGVEAAMFPSFWNALHDGNRPLGGPTLAEGIAVKNVGRLTFPIVRKYVSRIALVEEPDIERAVNAFATHQRTMAEGAGAAGLAAMLADPAPYQGKRVGLVLCGGNIDARLLASIMVRELERESRIMSFRIVMQDRPGLLGTLATQIGQSGANILEVAHRRLMLDVPARSISVDLTVEIRDSAHAEQVLADLAAAGMQARKFRQGSNDPIAD